MAPKASGSKAALATFVTAMACETARVESFQLTAPHKWPHPAGSATNKSKSSASTRKATFPSIASLARAGLFFDPASNAMGGRGKAATSDTCTHYICGTQISGWKSGDDAIERLRSANHKCPTVLLHDSLELQLDKEAWLEAATAATQSTAKGKHAKSVPAAKWKEYQLLPTGESMVQARLMTFGDAWPYDSKKGWKPTSVRMAEAGFHHEPSEEDQDNARCIYCERMLGGWEKGDEPRAQHERGTKDTPCPFFVCELEPDVVEETEKLSGEVQEVELSPPKARSASTRRRGGKKEEREISADEAETAKPPAVKARSASTRRKGAKAAEAREAEEEENTEAEQEQAPEEVEPPPVPAKTRGRNNTRETIQESADAKEEPETPARPAASSSPRLKHLKLSSSAGSDDPRVPVRASSRAASRAASQGIKASLEEEREAAITRPKYPTSSVPPTSDKPVVTEEAIEEEIGEGVDSTVIEHAEAASELDEVEAGEASAAMVAVQAEPARTKKQARSTSSNKGAKEAAADADDAQGATEVPNPTKRGRTASGKQSSESDDLKQVLAVSDESLAKRRGRKVSEKLTIAVPGEADADPEPAEEAAVPEEGAQPTRSKRTRTPSARSVSSTKSRTSSSTTSRKASAANKSNASSESAPLSESGLALNTAPAASVVKATVAGSKKARDLLASITGLEIAEKHRGTMTVESFLSAIGDEQIAAMQEDGSKRIAAQKEVALAKRHLVENALR